MNNLNHLSEQELVQLYLKGNTEALSNLVSRYKDRIYTAIFLLVKDKYLAEDLFQDVFIRVIDSLKAKGYSNEGKFLPWALRIAHYADLSFIEIASITKCSTNTALGRMRYGLINMRKMTLEKKIAF